MTHRAAHAHSRDAERLHCVRRHLQVLDEAGPPVLQTLLPLLGQMLGLEKAIAYAVERAERAWELTLGESTGLAPGVFKRQMGALVGTSDARWGHFNPMSPEPGQRNRAVAAEVSEQMSLHSVPFSRRAASRACSRRPEVLTPATHPSTFEMFRGIGVLGHWQLRVLVCEDDGLLAWVGGFRSEPFGPRERRLLQALTPALQRRLGLEQVLRQGPLARASLAAALEEVSSSAFIVDEAGALRHANAAGRSRMDLHPAATRGELREAGAGRTPDSFRRVAIRGTGLAPHWLLVATSARGPEEQLSAARRRWALTPRQCQVLGLLVRGEANKTISLHLQCAVRTVEQHVTALLAKVGVDSRAALAAKFWRST